jgi:L-alanine-DL-glutamate epimerase-like enolase superfamily enzyme
MPLSTDITVVEAETFCVNTPCRTNLKFGSVVVGDLPTGYARVVVETIDGRRGVGWGAMFLMDLWAWPLSKATHEQKNAAMREVLAAYAKALTERPGHGHPIELFRQNEAALERLARDASERHTPGEQLPFLGALVSASPVDHAVHDAYGNALGMDSYRCYGNDHMSFDLSRYLGDEYCGVYPSQFLREDFQDTVPVFHLVGGLDVLREKDAPSNAPDDGVPNSLEKWIERDGVFCLKVKLKGTDLAWDLDRTEEVARIYHDVRENAAPSLPARPFLTADTNEQCESPAYIVEYLAKLKERARDVYDDVLYIEQPTERDLRAHSWDMRPITAHKPVLIDESLMTVDDFKLAVELGWSGIALKSCKCLSSDLIFIAMAERRGIPYAVQDLTNPSIALLESVGLAARINTIKGVEANSRQFFPSANDLVARVHPGVAQIRGGVARTGSLSGTGLGMRIEEIPAFEEHVRGNAMT